MKIYGAAGITDFVILLGYKGYMIKEFFANYFLHTSDMTIDLSSGTIKTLGSNTEPWTVTLLDTGEETMTGGRLLRARDVIGDDTFSFTYGDGVTDLDNARRFACTACAALHRRADGREDRGSL
jgi:glucose-1-phosphate cytidylyltransferase